MPFNATHFLLENILLEEEKRMTRDKMCTNLFQRMHSQTKRINKRNQMDASYSMHPIKRGR